MLYSLWLTLAYLGMTALSFYILYRVVKKAVKSAILNPGSIGRALPPGNDPLPH